MELACPPASKLCSHCGHDKPLSSYGPRPDGRFNLRAECKSCYAANHRTYRKHRHAKRVDDFLRGVRQDRDRRAVYALGRCLARTFGGPEQMAQELRRRLDELCERDKTGRIAGGFLRSFLHLSILEHLDRPIVQRRRLLAGSRGPKGRA